MRYLLTLLLIIGVAQAQNIITITNGSTSACNDYFSDSQGPGFGGAGNPYGNNENFTFTLCPAGGSPYVHLDFFLWDIGLGDTLWVYDGNNTAAPLIGTYWQLSGPQTIAANPTINTSGCLTFVWASDSSDVGAGWNSVLSCDPPCQPFMTGINYISHDTTGHDGFIDVCQQDTVEIEAFGIFTDEFWYDQTDQNTDFIWVFGDSTIVDTSQLFTLPIDTTGGAYRITLYAVDSNGCSVIEPHFTFIRVSPTPDFSAVGPVNDPICWDDEAEIVTTISPTTWSNSDSGFLSGTMALPDGSGSAPGIYPSALNFAMFNQGDTVVNTTDVVRVFMNIEHSFIGDLSITLSCPNGSTVSLKSFPGGGGRWLGEACDASLNVPGIGWDYEWPTTVTPVQGTMNAVAPACTPCVTVLNPCNTAFSGATLPSTSYTTVTAMSNLVGCPLNGTWTLTIVDQWGSDDGTLFNWGIEFDSALLPSTIITYTPQIDSVWTTFDSTVQSFNGFNGDTALIAASIWDTTLDVTINTIDNFGCSYDTTVSYSILSPCDAACKPSNPLAVGMSPVGCPGDSTGLAWVDPKDTLIYGPFTFYWVDPAGDTVQTNFTQSLTDTLFNVPSGQYWAHVQDTFGCTYIKSIIVSTVFPMLNNIVGLPSVSCFDSSCDGIATVNSYYGTQPFSYLWSSGDTTTTSTSLCQGAQWVEVTDGAGCVDTLTLNVSAPPPITISAFGDDTICISNTAPIGVTANGGIPPYQYTWSNGATSATTNVSPVLDQSYTVQVTDANNCPADTDTVHITVREPLRISFGQLGIICPGSDFTLSAQAFGGDGTFNYQWSHGPNGASVPAVGAAQSSYYQVTVTDGCGSPAVVDSIWVPIGGMPPIQATTNGDVTICAGEVHVITAAAGGGNGNYTFTWDQGLPLGNSQVVTPNATTTYTLTVTDDCYSTPGITSVTVTVGSFKEFEVFVDKQTDCAPGVFTFSLDTVIPNFYYEFDFGNGWQIVDPTQDITKTLNAIGCHDIGVRLYSAEGCLSEKELPCFVEVFPVPEAEFSYDPYYPTTAEPTVEIIDFSKGASSWYYEIDDGTISDARNWSHTFSDSGQFVITQIVSNEYACSDTSVAGIRIIPSPMIWVPNSFTPNADGLNDVFIPKGIYLTETEYKMLIFDRWGNLIFETTDPNIGWDGNLGSEPAQVGTYTYSIYYQHESGANKWKQGSFNLIR